MHHVSGWVSASAIYMLVGDPVVLVASVASGAPKRLTLCVSLAGLRRCPGSWWNIVRLWLSVRMAVLAHMCGLHAHCRGPREKSKVEKVRTCSLCRAQGPTPAASLGLQFKDGRCTAAPPGSQRNSPFSTAKQKSSPLPAE